MPSETHPTNVLVGAITKVLLDYGKPLLDDSINESAKPFTGRDLLLPHVNSSWWGWTHYAVSIPSLPEPYRYLNIMAFIGHPGILIMDNDHLCAPDARNTTTVLATTGHGDAHYYEGYDASTSCSFEEDGSRLAWGDELVITNNFPKITVAGRFPHMSVDLEIVVSEHASWYSRVPIYDHVCVLSRYSGTIKDDRGTTPISGMGSFEYARAMTAQALQSTPIPPHLKIPVDFFTYQVVQLDEHTQLRLDLVTARGTHVSKTARFARYSGGVEVYREVELEVVKYNNHRATDPQGRSMTVPERFHWSVRNGGKEVVSITATVDTPLRFGLCRGYVGGYSFAGQWLEKPVNGRGYVEWIDVTAG
ncbi:hypothetical protein NLG97_g2934 [Lecanicillium saksenae]|uniref:Uncharacterized protein n=1 Tax=Lecanicillium saksenae TaxID=468837 RepID=A0ACC1R3J3_9HYPO|nr:hypothetical protein NLG97_g2934 [Lecanicillium saksenae]